MKSKALLEAAQETSDPLLDEFVLELVGESDALGAFMGSGHCSCSCPDDPEIRLG